MRISDWSSDVCSSDLGTRHECRARLEGGWLAKDGGGNGRVCGVQDLKALIDSALSRVARARRSVEHQILGHVILELYDAEDVADRLVVPCLAIIAAGAWDGWQNGGTAKRVRSEEHTSELKSIMRSSYAVFCLKKKTT